MFKQSTTTTEAVVPGTDNAEILKKAISVVRQAERSVEHHSRQHHGHEAVRKALADIYRVVLLFESFPEERARFLERKKLKTTRPPDHPTQPVVRAFYKGTSIEPATVTRYAEAIEEARSAKWGVKEFAGKLRAEGGYTALAKAYRGRKNTDDERKRDALDLKTQAEALITWGEWHAAERATEGHRTDLNLVVIDIREDGAYRLGCVIPAELDSIRRRIIESRGKQ